MKVSCNEDVANHVGSESCVGTRKDIGEELTGEDAGRVLSLDSFSSGTVECRRRPDGRKATMDIPISRGTFILRVV